MKSEKFGKNLEFLEILEKKLKFLKKVLKNDTCMVIDNHKHASRSMMVHAYIWRHQEYLCMCDD